MKTLLIILLCMIAFIPVFYLCEAINEKLSRTKKLKFVIHYRARHSSKVKRLTAYGDQAAKFEVDWINKYKNVVVRIDVFDGRKQIDTGKADDIFN